MTDKTITGLLINPFDRTVKTIECRAGSLQDIYEAIQCQTFDVAGFEYKGSEYSLFIDDEGLFKSPDDQAYFFWQGRFFAGRAVIFGVNPSGDSISCGFTQHDIAVNGWLGFPDHDRAAEHAQNLINTSPTIIAF